MRRIVAWMMALLLCVVGTGCGRQLGSPISYADFTGTYPVEGYVPSQEDLGRAPYSYAGAGPHFSVVLNVRQASEAERSVLIQGKWASAETMAQSGADFPERSEEYNALALKATEEAMAGAPAPPGPVSGGAAGQGYRGAPAPLPSAVQHGDLLWGGTGGDRPHPSGAGGMKGAGRGHAAGAFPTAAYPRPRGA